jgi:hypothetical protein
MHSQFLVEEQDLQLGLFWCALTLCLSELSPSEESLLVCLHHLLNQTVLASLCTIEYWLSVSICHDKQMHMQN